MSICVGFVGFVVILKLNIILQCGSLRGYFGERNFNLALGFHLPKTSRTTGSLYGEDWEARGRKEEEGDEEQVGKYCLFRSSYLTKYAYVFIRLSSSLLFFLSSNT